MFYVNIVLWTGLVTAKLITLTKCCTNPHGEEGECKNITQCESMREMVHRHRKTQAELEFMINSICGFEGLESKVCCAFKAPVSTAVKCHTPDGAKGHCIDIQTCPRAVSALTEPVGVTTEVRTFWNNSRCPGPGESYYVCCATPPVHPDRVSTQCEWSDPHIPPAIAAASSADGQCSAVALPVDASSGCCGVQVDTEAKIQGGDATGIYRYPWMALIEYRHDGRISTNCGGSLISGRYVLTAAHCVDRQTLRGKVAENVRLGEYDTSNCGADCVEAAGGGQDCNDMPVRIRVERVIKHVLYGRTPFYMHDIALIRLAQMAPFTTFIAPICLPTVDVVTNPPNSSLIVAGWGAYNNATTNSNLKQHVAVPYVNHTVCSAWKRYRSLGAGQICAGGEIGKDSCAGDSGGALVHAHPTADGPQYEVVGIVSFGTTPCAGRYPAIHTSVIKYMEWIITNMRE